MKFPGVHAAAASTMAAAFTAFFTVGENAPPVDPPPSSNRSPYENRASVFGKLIPNLSSLPSLAWMCVGEVSSTGEGLRTTSRPFADSATMRRVTELELAPPLFTESAVPGVLPAPVLLKERSKSSVLPCSNRAAWGVTGVRAYPEAGFGDFGVRGVRDGRTGVCANRFAMASSCACNVDGESGCVGFSLSNKRVCCGGNVKGEAGGERTTR